MKKTLLILWGTVLLPAAAQAAGSGHDHSTMQTIGPAQWFEQAEWAVIMGVLAMGALTWVLVRKAAAKLAPVDILDYGNLRAFVKSRWYPAVFQIPTMMVFGFIAYHLFFGSYYYSENSGSILVWTFWWAILPFSFVLVGRLWCAVCPFAWISDFVQKHWGKRKKIPWWMGRYSFWIVDIIFILITWFDRVFGMTEHPFLTGLIFLGLFAGVTVCGLLYEKRAFCRYICFLGNVSGNYSMVAPLELKPKNPETCKTCVQKNCFSGNQTRPGCPYSLAIPTKDGNRFCVLCGNCVKVCPHDNVALSIRPFGSDFWRRSFVRFEESFFAKMLVGIVIIQNIGMLSLWGMLSSWVQNLTGITDEKLLFTLIYFLTMIVPIGLMFISSAISSKTSKEKTIQNFARFGYAFIAVDLAGHLAHNLNHLIGEGKTYLAVLGGIFSGELRQFIDASLLSYGTVKILQYLILIAGVAGTFAITMKIAEKKATDKKQMILTALPHLILLGLLMILNFYIFSLPMVHRA